MNISWKSDYNQQQDQSLYFTNKKYTQGVQVINCYHSLNILTKLYECAIKLEM